ncbi:MAG: Fmu (Sun) domain-containing protein [Chitinophagaceae bacterium]|nr:Fmu (Sun) domain-containing protein [Chitinophagaceae bacterium]
MRYHSYLNSAKTIIDSYRGDVPFAAFLKKYFNAHKKYGGKDRKQIAALCYNFYRLGKALPQLPVEEKIIVAVFLCEEKSSDFLQFHKPEWNEIITKPLDEKIAIAGFTAEDVFPWAEELSSGIDAELFRHSFFKQPDLFLRIRPGNKETVVKKLQDAGIGFVMINDNCIALPNSTKIDNLLETDKEVVVQDFNSQQVLDFFKDEARHIVDPVSVWDCCAASGGKSILAYDTFYGKIDLTVSDIRESILSNLKNRFETAGIKNYKSFIADLTETDSPQGPADQLPTPDAQLIICDAPCTGSGTWSRTPEQLYYLKRKTIDVYVAMQQQIVSNVIPHLQTGGLFIYITCSVFKNENEDMVSFITKKFHLQLLQMELLKGYDKKADSMFVAVFGK